MAIGPSYFSGHPVLQTYHLPGVRQYGATMFFSSDDKYLIIHGDNGSLQVWSVPTRQVMFSISQGDVAKVSLLDDVDGIGVVVDDRIIHIDFTKDALNQEILIRGIPRIHDEDPVDLFVSTDNIVLCTSELISCFDPATYQLRTSCVIEGHSDRAIRVLRLRKINDFVYLRIVSASFRGLVASHWYSTFNVAGVEVARFSVDVQDFHLARAANGNVCLAIIENHNGPSIAIVDSEKGPMRLCSIQSFEAGMLMFLAENGYAFAGVKPRFLVVWKGGDLIQKLDCDGQWYNIQLSNDGARAVITYCNGKDDGSPNITGV